MPHPRIQELLNHLQRQHGGLLQAIDQVPPPLRDRRPALDRWSVADVMQHLALVEGRLARTLGDRVTLARTKHGTRHRSPKSARYSLWPPVVHDELRVYYWAVECVLSNLAKEQLDG